MLRVMHASLSRILPIVAALCVVLLAAGCKSGQHVVRSAADFPKGRGFLVRTAYADRELHRFVVFLPKNYDPRFKYPTVLFLHGLFEGGDDVTKPLAVGLGPEIARDPAAWPFITIFPQSKGTWKGDANDRMVMACLAETARQFSIDRERIILAGLSYGGLGTWQIGARHADVFAALVPVGGFSDQGSAAPLKRTPVWAFHYSGDIIVPVRHAREMVAELRQIGGNARLTEYAGMGHNPWEKVAAADSGAVSWMLRQRLSPDAVTAAAAARSKRPPLAGAASASAD
ncbi:MAG TPA: prolyl oligopeptidase family serine peptidase [Tepidisphaeraceae bacterium]|nr:prolyl oligopeptidase family serine peptidase [Tepidisphaeraceae bacterium]